MIELVITGVVSAVFGGVFSYLFLRVNPAKKKVLDDFTDEQSDKLKK